MPNPSKHYGTIKSIERMDNSPDGNPRHRIHLRSGVYLDTAPDASVGHVIANPEYADVPVLFTLNSRGQITDAKLSWHPAPVLPPK